MSEQPLKSFVLLKNNNKKEEKHPDYRISAKIDGEFQDIGACWIKVGKNDSKYLSCQLSSPKDLRCGYRIEIEPAPLKETSDKEDIEADSIPF